MVRKVRFDLSLPRSMMSLKSLLLLTKPIRYETEIQLYDGRTSDRFYLGKNLGCHL